MNQRSDEEKATDECTTPTSSHSSPVRPNTIPSTVCQQTPESVPSWKDPGPPPDKGFVAWRQATMGHLMVFNTWGYIASYGLFQTWYVQTLGHPPSDIAWIGSCQIFLLFFIGTFSGRALDAGMFHLVYRTGVVFQLVGIFMTSISTKYWQLFLSQGICTGIGNGLVFTPTMGVVSTYFSKHKSLALSFAAAGSTTGGVILPLIVRQLLPQVGFGWSVRVVGFVILATSAITVVILKPRVPPRKSGPIVEWNAFKDLTYTFVCIGMFLNMWALYFGFYYIGTFSRNVIGFDYVQSINLLMVINGVGLFGRILPGYIADLKFGALNTITPFALISGIIFFGWIGINTTAGVYVLASLYGFFTGGVQSMFPATVSSLTTDLSKSGVRMGMAFSFVSLATLTGPPLGGALIQAHNGGYLYAQVWGGCCLVCGGLALATARVLRTGWRLKQRV